MSKGAVGLVAGYWPEEIDRYLPTPGLSLDEALAGRPARRRPQGLALVAGSQRRSYQELADGAGARARALLGQSETRPGELADSRYRLALAIADPVELLTCFLGAAQARCFVLLLDPGLPAEELRRLLGSFRPDLLVADGEAQAKLAPAKGDIPLLSPQELPEQGPAPTRRAPVDLRSPSIALPGIEGGLVHYSQSSLVAGALSWSTFVPLREEDVLLTAYPLCSWEGLYSVLPVLFRGGTVIHVAGDTEAAVQHIDGHRPRYAFLGPAQALAMAAREGPLLRALRRSLAGVFLPLTAPLRATVRQRLSRAFAKPILTLYGSTPTGPVLASHPSWFLDEAVGIPITNVDTWPLNPATGNPLRVAWEAVEYGEVGVKSPMAAVELEPPALAERWVREGWHRTGMVATMDPNGFFYWRSKTRLGEGLAAATS